MKLYVVAALVVVLILVGAVATILIARSPAPESFFSDFEKVYQLYDEKKYEEAAAAYQELLDRYKVESADLYFNLANAHFKAEHIGPAVFYYKKTLKLKPNDHEIQFNLRFAQQEYGLVSEEKKGWFGEKFMEFINLTSIHRATKLTVVFYWVFLLALALALFTRKRTIAYVCVAASAIFVLMLGYSCIKYGASTRHPEGVVLVEEAAVKYSCEQDDKTAFTLKGGAVVDILNSKKDWYQIRLPDGRSGWIKTGDLGEV